MEARINGDALDKDARGGAFIRYEWQGGEISIAGGVAGQFFEDANSNDDALCDRHMADAILSIVTSPERHLI